MFSRLDFWAEEEEAESSGEVKLLKVKASRAVAEASEVPKIRRSLSSEGVRGGGIEISLSSGKGQREIGAGYEGGWGGVLVLT